MRAKLNKKLYIVGTPIGNLNDISQRAIDTLREVDFIVAEDIRVTLKLLNKYHIKKPLISFHKFSSKRKAENIIKLLENKTAALVTDAGMPCISDPGDILVRKCHENNINLKVVPGPCALTAAISISGMNCSRFSFFGFLPIDNKKRSQTLLSLKKIQHAIILYEAPHKLKRTFKDLLLYFKDRKIAIAKELTKIHENIEIYSLEQAERYYSEKDIIKGEYVLIIEGCSKKHTDSRTIFEQCLEFTKKLINSGEKLSDACRKSADIYSFKKNDIYKAIIQQYKR